MADFDSGGPVVSYGHTGSAARRSTEHKAKLETGLPEGTNKIITLQVDHRRFMTRLATLTSESGFFASMFSGRWQDDHNSGQQPDGSYFVDGDPELFGHILRYLRHGNFPLFYVNGAHDYGMYAALLGEARYFQIDRLVTWLESKKYLDALKIQSTVNWTEGIASSKKSPRQMRR